MPYGFVSDQTDAEVRVGFYNDSAPGTITVEWQFEQSGVVETLEPQTKQAAAAENLLFTTWFSTAGLSGTYTITAVVSKDGTETARLSDTLTVMPVEAGNRAVPLLNTVFMDPGAFVDEVYEAARSATEQDVREELNALKDAGISNIILTYAEYVLNGWTAFYPSQIPELMTEVTLVGNTEPTVLKTPLEFDFVGTVLDQAQKNGQKVFVGIGRGTDSWITFDTRAWLRPEEQTALNPEYLQEHVDFAKRVADELYELYGDYDSFYGWYFSHECQDISWANLFYNPVSDYLHAIAPEKPVLASPAAVTPWLIVEQLRTALGSSKVDIFNYQDSVGAGYDETTFTYTYNPEVRLGQMDAMYQKYLTEHQNSGQRKHFWANIESWEMEGPEYTGAYPADFARFQRQIDIVAQYVDSVTSYESGGFLESPASTLGLGGQKAVDLYTAYRRYYDEAIGRSYTIEVIAGAGGTVSGETEAAFWDSRTFTVKPEAGYYVKAVKVDGVPATLTDGTYVFTNIAQDHRLEVQFAPVSIKPKPSRPIAPPEPEAPALPFCDVETDDWFYEDVAYLYERGLMNGVGDRRFAPQGPITRGAIVTILHRLEGMPAAAEQAPFQDVDQSSYCADAVAWAAETGIVSGYGDGRFGPDDAITREQVAAILYRYAALRKMDIQGTADLSAFTDRGSVSAFAEKPLAWAVNCGIVQGSGGCIRPQGTAARCQAAAMVHRFCALA